ncbi:hypothetical protein GWI33_003755, partial [Rhynchophorus ferrugineus]
DSSTPTRSRDNSACPISSGYMKN